MERTSQMEHTRPVTGRATMLANLVMLHGDIQFDSAWCSQHSAVDCSRELQGSIISNQSVNILDYNCLGSIEVIRHHELISGVLAKYYIY
jgi:hypothetical protein